MISVRPARPAECPHLAKNFDIVIFLDTVNLINDKLCMVVLLIHLYLFISILVTLTFKVSVSKQF